MKNVIVSLMLVLVTISSAMAQVVNYGATGASIQGREYWFNRVGDQERFDKDWKETTKQYSRFQACDMQKVYQQNRWQTCSSCGMIITSPRQALNFQTRCW